MSVVGVDSEERFLGRSVLGGFGFGVILERQVTAQSLAQSLSQSRGSGLDSLDEGLAVTRAQACEFGHDIVFEILLSAHHLRFNSEPRLKLWIRRSHLSMEPGPRVGLSSKALPQLKSGSEGLRTRVIPSKLLMLCMWLGSRPRTKGSRW